jgi:hypothetical protein
MRRRMLVLCAAGAAAVAGCAAPRLSDYTGQTPRLDLREYFNGTVDGWGLFADRSGKVIRRFKVVMDCSWQGDQGLLDEAFTYSDGSRERRVWRLQRLDDGRYTGQAGDVVGTASGQESGNAFYWRYTLALPVEGQVYQVQMDDWMYLMSERVLLNKTVMSKFGLRVGEVTLSFSKR